MVKGLNSLNVGQAFVSLCTDGHYVTLVHRSGPLYIKLTRIAAATGNLFKFNNNPGARSESRARIVLAREQFNLDPITWPAGLLCIQKTSLVIMTAASE